MILKEVVQLATLLNVNEAALLRLACDIAHTQGVQRISDLTQDHRLELYLFLHRAAIAEGKIPAMVKSQTMAA